jgi:4-amino-4-deoxy-L-arabinose transferase-like glycosyltransferase
MQKLLIYTRKLANNFKKEVKSHPFIYLFLGLLIFAGSFVRLVRLDSVLGFYFDQGRDAQVIWDFLRDGKFFLIGPTTGIAGIFRGPFYYYLITPAYLFGGGDPLYPAIFLGLLSIASLVILYLLAKEISGRFTGLIAVFFAGLSYYMVYASRWLSNPTPMLLISMLLVWFLFRVVEGKRWYLVPIAFLSGASLFHFGSSGEFFMIFAIALISIISSFKAGKFSLPPVKIIVLSIFAFFLTALPLIVFDIRHDGILRSGIAKFFVADASFDVSKSINLSERLTFLQDVFYSKIFHGKDPIRVALTIFIMASFLVLLPRLVKNKKLLSLIIFLSSPFVGFMIFRGNEGNVYDYYLTVYYMPFILLLSVVVRKVIATKWGIAPILLIAYFFVQSNIPPLRSYLSDGLDGPTTISLGNQKQAIEWVYKDAAGRKFNTDFYVPPVIPHSYKYLFEWYESKDNFNGLVEERVELLYTISEVDPPHPARVEAWRKRQEGIGMVEETVNFGGISVERRKRLE